MRTKQPRIVVTFATTSDAMAMEALAREQGVPGRIIPVPSEIDAGCGLAWCAEVDERPALEKAFLAFGLEYEGIFEIELY